MQPRRVSSLNVPISLVMPHDSPSGYGASRPYPQSNTHTFHARSDSTSNSTSNPRSVSPALSVASADTSISEASKSPRALPPLPMSPALERHKSRKQRLFNVDRKAICQYHLENPNARQEDIATRYGVERSTISKILKNKTKWMNVPDSETLRVAKHR
jgi:CENP-B N-terminal DNA-binding domain